MLTRDRYHGFSEAASRRCSLRCSQNLQENTCNFIKKEALAQVFSCEVYENFKKTFLHRTPPVAASWFWSELNMKLFEEIWYIFWRTSSFLLNVKFSSISFPCTAETEDCLNLRLRSSVCLNIFSTVQNKVLNFLILSRTSLDLCLHFRFIQIIKRQSLYFYDFTVIIKKSCHCIPFKSPFWRMKSHICFCWCILTLFVIN